MDFERKPFTLQKFSIAYILPGILHKKKFLWSKLNFPNEDPGRSLDFDFPQ